MKVMVLMLAVVFGFNAYPASFEVITPNEGVVVLESVVVAEGTDIDSDYKEVRAFDKNGKMRFRAFWRGVSRGLTPSHQIIEIFNANGKRVDMSAADQDPLPAEISKEDFDVLFATLGQLEPTELINEAGNTGFSAIPKESECAMKMTYTRKPLQIIRLESVCKN